MKFLTIAATFAVLLPCSMTQEPLAGPQENRIKGVHQQSLTGGLEQETVKRWDDYIRDPRTNIRAADIEETPSFEIKAQYWQIYQYGPKEQRHMRQEQKHMRKEQKHYEKHHRKHQSQSYRKHHKGNQHKQEQFEQISESAGKGFAQSDQGYLEQPHVELNQRFQLQEDLWTLMGQLSGPQQTERVPPIDHSTLQNFLLGTQEFNQNLFVEADKESLMENQIPKLLRKLGFNFNEQEDKNLKDQNEENSECDDNENFEIEKQSLDLNKDLHLIGSHQQISTM